MANRAITGCRNNNFFLGRTLIPKKYSVTLLAKFFLTIYNNYVRMHKAKGCCKTDLQRAADGGSVAVRVRQCSLLSRQSETAVGFSYRK